MCVFYLKVTLRHEGPCEGESSSTFIHYVWSCLQTSSRLLLSSEEEKEEELAADQAEIEVSLSLSCRYCPNQSCSQHGAGREGRREGGGGRTEENAQEDDSHECGTLSLIRHFIFSIELSCRKVIHLFIYCLL